MTFGLIFVSGIYFGYRGLSDDKPVSIFLSACSFLVLAIYLLGIGIPDTMTLTTVGGTTTVSWGALTTATDTMVKALTFIFLSISMFAFVFTLYRLIDRFGFAIMNSRKRDY